MSEKIIKDKCPTCGAETRIDTTPRLVAHGPDHPDDIGEVKLNCGCGEGIAGSDLVKIGTGQRCGCGIWSAKCHKGHVVKIYV